jgi:hypothetical protein
VEDLFKVLVEVRILRDHQVVFKDSLDEVLATQKILELVEVNGILGCFRFKGIDQSLKLVMSVNTSFLDVIKKLMLEKISSVL